MSWQPELDELREREQQARELGGAARGKRQHDRGRHPVRARIAGLVEAGSFYELGAVAGKDLYDSVSNPVANALNRVPCAHLYRYELGGWEIQTRCGAVDHAVDSEEEAFACTRRFLSYLPSSVFEVAARGPQTDDPGRREEFLFEVIPRDRRKVYKMRPIIDAVVDQGSFFEMGRMFGRPIITGLARLDGLPVAILASDPYHYGGAWTADACAKTVRFVDMA